MWRSRISMYQGVLFHMCSIIRSNETRTNHYGLMNNIFISLSKYSVHLVHDLKSLSHRTGRELQCPVPEAIDHCRIWTNDELPNRRGR